MILAIYVIGSAIALIMLTIRLHDARDQLRRTSRERDTYAVTLETSLLAPPAAGLKTPPTADGPVLPGPVHGERS